MARARVMKPRPTLTALRSRLLQRKCACGGTPGPTGECEACHKKRLLRKVAQPSTLNPQLSEVPPIVHEVLRSPGQPLDRETRAFFEPRFGHDFSQVRTQASGSVSVPARLAVGAPHDEFEQEAETIAQSTLNTSSAPVDARHVFSGVRIHTDAKAAESAWAVTARAYTVGNHIVFGAGQFSPGTNAGRRLLAHELTHVIQQRGGRVSRTASATASLEPGDGRETQTSCQFAFEDEHGGEPILQRDLAIQPPHPRTVGRVLNAAAMQAAIAFDQRVVAVIGAAGIRELRDVLGISPDPAVIDEDFVRAVVQWQAVQGLGQDGQLGPGTARPLFREIGAEGVGRGALVSGPTYHATLPLAPPVVGGFQQAGFRFEAEFADDPANELYASCCEVHQFVQWDAAFAAAAGGVPHAGFPAGTAAGTWIEDRDGTDTLRYGHRSGPHSGSLGAGNEYIDNTSQRNPAFGNIYRGRDFPGTPLHAGHFRFMVRAFDICNGNRALGDDFLRVTWA